jgi:glycosyltransferase involved in cell wall biosynthesis
MIQKKLRIAVIAPPWLALPVKGYGGIELVLQGLIDALRSRDDIEVEVFANGERTIRGIKTHSLFKKEQFSHIYEPYFESYAIIRAHLEYAYNYIKDDGHFDMIHDHVPHIGPAFWSMASSLDKALPPILHTFHGPPFTAANDKAFGSVYNTEDIRQIKHFGSWYASCISEAMALTAPQNVVPRLVSSVHNGVVLKDFPFQPNKKDYFVTLARFAPYKGQHIAVEAAEKLKKRLRMAGTVADIGSSRKLMLELSNPLSRYRNDPQFIYYSDKILPHVLQNPRISYSGSLSGKRKIKFLSEAKALLFPITWDEPFGMNRGAMPEIIQHGVNGFLANTVDEFEEYMLRINEIDPKACRDSVVHLFSHTAMTDKYVASYKDIIKREAEKVS